MSLSKRLINPSPSGPPLPPAPEGGPISAATQVGTLGNNNHGFEGVFGGNFSPDGSTFNIYWRTGSSVYGVWCSNNKVPTTSSYTNGYQIIGNENLKQYYANAQFNYAGNRVYFYQENKDIRYYNVSGNNHFRGFNTGTLSSEISTGNFPSKVYGGIKWSNTGQYFYYLDNGNRIRRYNSLVGLYDMPTSKGSPDQNVSMPQSTRFFDISNDGSKLYLAQDNGTTTTVREYNMSTNWDLSSLSFVGSINVSVRWFCGGFSVNPIGNQFVLNDYGQSSYAPSSTNIWKVYNF